MSEAIVKLRLDTSNYQRTLKSATKELQNTVAQVREMGATFAVTDKEENAFAQSFGRLATSASSTKQQLREITGAINDLKMAYAGMTAEEQNSPFGQSLRNSINELIERAGVLKDTMADTTQAISNASSDTRGFDQLIGTANVMVGAYGMLSAGAELFGNSTLSNSEAMKKLQATIALCSSAQTLQNALQKQGAVYQGVLAVQARARAVAEALATKGTIGATVAQKAFNLVAQANPYVLLASAIVAVGTALYAFTQKTDEASEASQKLSEKVKDQQSLMQGTAEKASGNVAEFEKLRLEWSSLRTDAEKTQWIHDNKSAFERLGLSVNSISDAFNVFVRDKAKYIQAMTEIAKASAYMDLAKEQFKRGIENSMKTTTVTKARAGDRYYNLTDEEKAYISKTKGNTVMRGGFLSLTEQGAKDLHYYRSLNALRGKDQKTKEYNDKGQQYLQGAITSENTANKLGLNSGGGKPKTPRSTSTGRTVSEYNPKTQSLDLGKREVMGAKGAVGWEANTKRFEGADTYAFNQLAQIKPDTVTPLQFQSNQGFKENDDYKQMKLSEGVNKLRTNLDEVSKGVGAGSSLVSGISDIITTVGGNSQALKTLTTILGVVSAVIQVATSAIEVGTIVGLIPSNRFNGVAGGLTDLINEGAIGGGLELTAKISGEDIYLSNRNYKRRVGK